MDPRRTARAPAGPPKREGGAVGGTGAAAGAAAGSAAGLAAGARRLPSGVPGLQGEIDQLGRDIQQLRIDFERFFSGALPWPPDELRGRIKGELRGLRNSSQATAVDRFRLGDMEARFNSYNELYNRRLRDVEEGRQRPRKRHASTRTAASWSAAVSIPRRWRRFTTASPAARQRRRASIWRASATISSGRRPPSARGPAAARSSSGLPRKTASSNSKHDLSRASPALGKEMILA